MWFQIGRAMLTGNLGAALTGSKWDLGLEEVSHRTWGDKPPNTNIRGKDPIDGVWASSTLEVVGFKILSSSNLLRFEPARFEPRRFELTTDRKSVV